MMKRMVFNVGLSEPFVQVPFFLIYTYCIPIVEVCSRPIPCQYSLSIALVRYTNSSITLIYRRREFIWYSTGINIVFHTEQRICRVYLMYTDLTCSSAKPSYISRTHFGRIHVALIQKLLIDSRVLTNSYYHTIYPNLFAACLTPFANKKKCIGPTIGLRDSIVIAFTRLINN